MTSVEVQSPSPPESESIASTSEEAPSSVYQWLSTVPVAYSVGSTLYGWYEGSKNYTRLSKRALDGVESSVKYVADTAAPVVKRPGMSLSNKSTDRPRALRSISFS